MQRIKFNCYFLCADRFMMLLHRFQERNTGTAFSGTTHIGSMHILRSCSQVRIREAETAHRHSLGFFFKWGIIQFLPRDNLKREQNTIVVLWWFCPVFHWDFFHCILLTCSIKESDIFPSPFKQITRVQETGRITPWIHSSNRTLIPASPYPLNFPLQKKKKK